MKLFLGVDGGQSSTTALIGDESGRVVGVGRGGPCNHVQASEGRAKFVGAIGGCLRAAGGEGVRFESACLGFSGGPADKEAILHEMISAERMTVTHDGLIALSGATGGEPGIIVIAGTGSFAFGRNAAGETGRAGGWGYVFGDEGGGFDLTRQALRAALRHEEGWGPPTALGPLLLGATGAGSVNELLHWFYTAEWGRPRIAAFAKMVDESAQEGDFVAQKLLRDAAQELAMFGSAVRGKLFGEAGRGRPLPAGGAFEGRGIPVELVSEQPAAELAAPSGPAAGYESSREAGRGRNLQARGPAARGVFEGRGVPGELVSEQQTAESVEPSGSAAGYESLQEAARERPLQARRPASGGGFEGVPVTVAYVGSVFRSSILLERFREVLELSDGVRVIAPVYGPAAGALIEAYRAVGLPAAISGVPENEK
jgi:N-acetylglucosamine kinase-like BadF-type ATPase